MPEQITKHPEITLQMLKGAGAHCGEGITPKILTACPAERFCALPTGELCIYGIGDIRQMTQIEPSELATVVCPPVALEQSAPPEAILGAFLFAFGLMVGAFARRHRR